MHTYVYTNIYCMHTYVYTNIYYKHTYLYTNIYIYIRIHRDLSSRHGGYIRWLRYLMYRSLRKKKNF